MIGCGLYVTLKLGLAVTSRDTVLMADEGHHLLREAGHLGNAAQPAPEVVVLAVVPTHIVSPDGIKRLASEHR